MELNYMQKRTWAEVDLDALKDNYRILRQRVPSTAKICCIIKADAYGHGALRVAQLYEELGADFLAVSNIEEAMTVRRGGIKSPLLILGYTHPSCAKILYDYGISQCVYSYEYGKELAEAANACGAILSIHLKLDVGMGRLGFVIGQTDGEIFEQALEICRFNCFRTEGIFTHFPMADEGKRGREVTARQFEQFCKITKKLEESGVKFDIKHCSNSAAAIKYPEYSLDMVRLGISLYGVLPSKDIKDVSLKNTISMKTVISNIKSVKKGDGIGYGSEYIANRNMLIATLPIGYADGFKRENFKNKTKVTVRGKLCSITGRVCMDQIMIDVSEVDGARVGDEVIIYGGSSEINLDEFSQNNYKIPYETMCEISARVPRVYYKDNHIESIRDSLV